MTHAELLKSKEYWLTQIQCQIYAEVEEYLEANNMTKQDLANKMGVDVRFISTTMNGNFNYKISHLVSLALAMNKALVISFEDFPAEVQP